MTRLGRWAPGLHAAAVAVGLVATFPPVLATRYEAGPDGRVQEQRYSFWETTVDPPPDPVDSFAFPVLHDPTLVAGGVVFVVALLAFGGAGLLAAAAGRRPGLAGRSRTASTASGVAVVTAVAVIGAQVVARTLPIDYGEVVVFYEPSLGPAFTLLCAAALLAVAAVLATWSRRPEPEVDLDTPPMGLRLGDPAAAPD